MTIRCEVHVNCEDPAVAKVGLPTKSAVWVCLRGFDDFMEGKEVIQVSQVQEVNDE